MPFNFGPEPSARQPVRRLVEEVLGIWAGSWVDGSDPKSVHEATLLSLSIEKAGALLGWYPTWSFSEAIEKTITWYLKRHKEKHHDMLKFSIAQIHEYVTGAKSKKLSWTE